MVVSCPSYGDDAIPHLMIPSLSRRTAHDSRVAGQGRSTLKPSSRLPFFCGMKGRLLLTDPAMSVEERRRDGTSTEQEQDVVLIQFSNDKRLAVNSPKLPCSPDHLPRYPIL